MAQLASAPPLGGGGSEFESRCPDINPAFAGLWACPPKPATAGEGGYRIVAIMSGFQPEDTGSTPVTRFSIK